MATEPTNTYIGIDPGASGGVVVLRGDNLYFLKLDGAKNTDILAFLRRFGRPDVSVFPPRDNGRAFAVIEKVGGFMGTRAKSSGGGKHRNVASAHTMFTFGQSYGGLLMALTAVGIEPSEIHPRTWQAGLGIVARQKHESKSQWKTRLKDVAKAIFPNGRIVGATADAALLTEYCRRLVENKL